MTHVSKTISTHLCGGGIGTSIRGTAGGGHWTEQAGEAAGRVDLLNAHLVLAQRRVRLNMTERVSANAKSAQNILTGGTL
jgi:hypothetical protein